MNASREQLEKAILFFAKKFNQEENYKALMSLQAGMPRIVEMISHEMFLHKFNSYHCTDEEYYSYKLIHEYATELRKEGWVEYEY